MLQQLSSELLHIIHTYSEKFALLTEDVLANKPNPEKWSKKEVIGHLIDSAHSNLRRFVVGQYQQHAKIVYDQDFWVIANQYQQMQKDELITLWLLLNKQITAVWEQMPEQNYLHVVDTGKDVISERTLMWLAEDYIKHLQHHLNQIFPSSFEVQY